MHNKLGNEYNIVAPYFQKLSEEVATAMNMKEEYNMALAENITLKKLVQAKDVLLIQKSQVLANVRVGCYARFWIHLQLACTTSVANL